MTHPTFARLLVAASDGCRRGMGMLPVERWDFIALTRDNLESEAFFCCLLLTSERPDLVVVEEQIYISHHGKVTMN